MKKIITILLTIIMVFSCLLTACGNNNTGGGTTGGTTVNTNYRTFTGTHIYNVEEAENDFLVKNGNSDYKILVSASQTKYSILGAQEIVTFFRQATGVSLPIVVESDTGDRHNDSQRIISIGNTELFKSSGLTADKSVLNKEGFRIVTVDKNVYIFAAGDVGNVYGAYEFLSQVFNFEYYSYDTIEIDTGVLDKKLPIFDVTDVPDFAIRKQMWGTLNHVDPNGITRAGYSNSAYLMNVGDTENGQPRLAFHNSGEVLPINAPTNEENWQSDSNNQLCYTAHGDVESWKRMVSRAAYVIERSLIDYPVAEYPDYIMCSISCEDEYTSCGCASCGAEAELYGAKSGSVIKFCNAVIKEVKDWMDLPENAAYKREEFYLAFFAYFQYLAPPAHYDEKLGKYVANHPDVELRDDVCVYYAISSMDSIVSIYDSANSNTKAITEAWFDIANATYLWTYGQNNDYYPSMWPTWEHYDAKGYQFYASGNPVMFQTQRYYDVKNETGFQGLTRYIEGKMLWNTNLDIEQLKDNWFNAMYGEAASIMKELFFREVYYTTNLYDKKGNRYAHGWGVSYAQGDWSITELEKWFDLIYKALAKNEEVYKNSNPEKYETIRLHISHEYYFPAYVIVLGYNQQTLGQLYVDVIKYLQANIDDFRGFVHREGRTEDTVNTWKDIIV